MRDKLEKIIKAYEELEKKLSDPAVASDIKEFTRLNKEYAHQSDLIAASREYIGALDDIEAAKEMLRDTTDADEKEMLQMDISENEEKLPQLEEDIKYMLIPSDPNDDKNTTPAAYRQKRCDTNGLRLKKATFPTSESAAFFAEICLLTNVQLLI